MKKTLWYEVRTEDYETYREQRLRDARRLAKQFTRAKIYKCTQLVTVEKKLCST